jgi:general secretion pathway protein I
MKSAHQAGFTLIEVLVALAILSIAVVACIEGFAQGLRLLKLAGDQQRAILLADEKAREVVDVRESQEQGVEGPFHWERTLSPIVAPDLIPATGQPLWRLYQIAVRVGWERRVVEVRTLRMVAIAGIAGATGAPGAPGSSGPGTSGSGSSSTGLGGLLGGGGSSAGSGSSSSGIGALLGGSKR